MSSEQLFRLVVTKNDDQYNMELHADDIVGVDMNVAVSCLLKFVIFACRERFMDDEHIIELFKNIVDLPKSESVEEFKRID